MIKGIYQDLELARRRIERARTWKDGDLRKFPIATLELIDGLADSLEAALTSGDGSESAGLRERAAMFAHLTGKMSRCSFCGGLLVWQNKEMRVAMCPNCVMERCIHAEVKLGIYPASLAPAISRPPTQGSAKQSDESFSLRPVERSSDIPPSRADLGGDRTDTRYENLKLLTDNFADQLDAIQEICIDAGIEQRDRKTKVEAVQELANRALAEGQQSSELVEKAPSASPGERESAVDDLRGEQCEHGWYKCVRCEREATMRRTIADDEAKI